MILILNAIENSDAVAGFNKDMTYICGKFQIHFAIRHIKENISSGISGRFSHLIISGSELRASVIGPWDDKLKWILSEFIQNKKPILGIC